jgi:coenzyme F420-reducing hydrogenase beta subunit
MVKVIIGYTETANPYKTKPFIARTVEDAEKLVFNNYCVNNLAVYLTHKEFKQNGIVGIVAKGCDVKTIIQLIQESQINKDDIYIIGINCNGQISEFGKEFGAETIATKCLNCFVRIPILQHTLIGTIEEMPKRNDANLEMINKLESMTSEERWEFWENAFER